MGDNGLGQIFASSFVYTTDGTNDYYTMDSNSLVFEFAHGTAISAVRLSITQQLMVMQVTTDGISFISNAYDATTLNLLIWMYLLSPIATYPNRQAYLSGLTNWLISIASALSTAVASINASSTTAQALAVTINYGPIVTNPGVTIPGALSINN